MTILELVPSHVTPGSLADEFTNPSGELLSPSRVTFGSLADEFTNPSGELLSPSRVTFGSLADEFTSPSGVMFSFSNVIFVHSPSCGIRVPAACLVALETFYARSSCFLL